MLCKINVLKNFVKFTGEHLCQSLVPNKGAGWNVSQNSQTNTCAGVPLLIKFQAKKFCKVTRKHLCCSLVFNENADWNIFRNSQENTFTGVLYLTKLHAGGKHRRQVADTLAFFYCAADNKTQVFCRIKARCPYSSLCKIL